MSNRRKFFRLRVIAPLLAALFATLLLPGASLYYSYSGGTSCARCHEIWQPYSDWHESAHRNVLCSECHGDVLTLDAGFHLKNIRQLAAHLRGQVPEQVRLKTDDVLKIGARCAKCHREEFADWSAGPHGATYSQIFLDKDHNQRRRLMDDCLRCHAMHFDGSIRDLVTPIDTKGPWRLLDPKLAGQPAIPCLACHQMHRYGMPLARPAAKADDAGPREEINRPSVALFDRRQQDYVSLASLPLPQMHQGPRPIKRSVPTSGRRSATNATRPRPAWARSVPATIARPSESTKDSVASPATKSMARRHEHHAPLVIHSSQTAA